MKPQNPTAGFCSEKQVAAIEVPVLLYFRSPETKKCTCLPEVHEFSTGWLVWTMCWALWMQRQGRQGPVLEEITGC